MPRKHKMPRPNTKAIRIIEMAQAGVDYREIAEAIGSTYPAVRTVVSWFRRVADIPQRETKADHIIAMAKAGADRGEIIVATGATPKYVLKTAMASGNALPRKRRQHSASTLTMIALAQDGVRPIDIAARLGVRPYAVSTQLCRARRRGVPVPTFTRHGARTGAAA